MLQFYQCHVALIFLPPAVLPSRREDFLHVGCGGLVSLQDMMEDIHRALRFPVAADHELLPLLNTLIVSFACWVLADNTVCEVAC